MGARRTGVCGLGYEGRTIDEFIGALLSENVNVVVDVRQMPLSRKRGFSKTALSAALQANGIAYVHERSLGNPKENRAGFGAEDSRPLAQRRFERELRENGADAMERVRSLSLTRRVALLCFEADESACHRACILAELRTTPGGKERSAARRAALG